MTEAVMWFLYVVRARDNSLYTGITTDVERRFAEHQGIAGTANQSSASAQFKGARALRGKGPLSLVFQQQVGNRSEASKLEYKVKRLSKATKEALIAARVTLDELFD